MSKIGRNDPCPCGSGNKYKKCCEQKAARRSFAAAKIDLAAASPTFHKAVGLTSLFQANTAAIPARTEISVPLPEAVEEKTPCEACLENTEA